MVDRNATGREPTLFSAILTPHRSLGGAGFLVLMLAVIIVSFASGLFFFLIGAWPVMGFLGLDVLLIYWAFRISYRTADAFEEVTVTPTGDVAKDLRSFLAAYTAVFSHPAAAAAMPGLIASYHSRPAAEFGTGRFAISMRPHFRAMLAAAAPGTVDPDVDADGLLDILIGSVMFRTMLLPFTDRAGAADGSAELLIRLTRPRADQSERT